MDQAFLMRAMRLLDRRPAAPLEHGSFVEAVIARQQETPTAQAAGRCRSPAARPERGDGLAALVLAEEGWRETAACRSGCFSRPVAARRGNIL